MSPGIIFVIWEICCVSAAENLRFRHMTTLRCFAANLEAGFVIYAKNGPRAVGRSLVCHSEFSSVHFLADLEYWAASRRGRRGGRGGGGRAGWWAWVWWLVSEDQQTQLSVGAKLAVDNESGIPFSAKVLRQVRKS